MAVYCGVCSVQIHSASENYGSFPSDDFGGWDRKTFDISPPRGCIQDTCESCARGLRAAVAREARLILESNLDRAEGLRIRIERERRKSERAQEIEAEVRAEVRRKMENER